MQHTPFSIILHMKRFIDNLNVDKTLNVDDILTEEHKQMLRDELAKFGWTHHTLRVAMSCYPEIFDFGH
jgi:hypothetical protein